MNEIIYRIKIYDNYHYMDEEEAYLYGSFSSYEEALTKAKSIIEEHIIYNYQPGMSKEEMYAGYIMFGEDPIIVSEPYQEDTRKFSAWDYAKEFSGKYYEQQSKINR